MDITDMEGIWPGNGSLGHTVRARNDKVILLKVKELDSQGKQWEVKPVFFVEKRKPLDKTGNDSLLFDIRDLAPAKMKERVDGCIRIDLCKDFQDFLSTSLTR
jgi:hypothetical protein